MVLFEHVTVTGSLKIEGNRTVSGVDYAVVSMESKHNNVEMMRSTALELAEALLKWAKRGVG